jgi:hypothetical protein
MQNYLHTEVEIRVSLIGGISWSTVMSFSCPVFSETAALLRRLDHQVCQRAHCIALRSQGYEIHMLMEIFGVSRKSVELVQ